MPITEEQREARKGVIGASDIAAIMGCDPWRTSYDVWLDKSGRLNDNRENMAMMAGTLLEPAVLRWAGLDEPDGGGLGQIAVPADAIEIPGTRMAANLDGITAAGEPVEAKTSGLFGPLGQEWGEPGTNDVPTRVYLQVHVQMMAVNAQVAWVPAFLGGRGFCLYRVERYDEICDQILAQALIFWSLVDNDRAPEAQAPSEDSIQRMRRQPGSVVMITAGHIEQWQAAKQTLKLAEAEEKDARTRLMQTLGEAEAGVAEDGRGITYLEQTRRSVRLSDLSEEEKKRLARTSTYRVLRFRPPGTLSLPAPKEHEDVSDQSTDEADTADGAAGRDGEPVQDRAGQVAERAEEHGPGAEEVGRSGGVE